MTRKETLKAAEQCVCGNREEDYGNPEDNFAIIAKLWSLWLEKDISAHDVAIMMTLLKIGRVKSGRRKDDNYTDLCGYAACAAEIAGDAATITDAARKTYDRWVETNGCDRPEKMKKIQCGGCLLNTLCFKGNGWQVKTCECCDLPELNPDAVIDAVEEMLTKAIPNQITIEDYLATAGETKTGEERLNV